MNYASRMSESRQYGVGVHDTNNLLETVKDLTEEELEDIGEAGNVFEDLATRKDQCKLWRLYSWYQRNCSHV